MSIYGQQECTKKEKFTIQPKFHEQKPQKIILAHLLVGQKQSHRKMKCNDQRHRSRQWSNLPESVRPFSRRCCGNLISFYLAKKDCKFQLLMVSLSCHYILKSDLMNCRLTNFSVLIFSQFSSLLFAPACGSQQEK